MPEAGVTLVKQPGQRKKPGRKVRVLIADDHSIIRRIVRSTLQANPRFEVCGEAENGAEAIEEAKKLKPDVVVLDVSMPVLNGLNPLGRSKRHCRKSAIVILSQNADQRFVEEARKIGVQAYVAKARAGEALVRRSKGPRWAMISF